METLGTLVCLVVIIGIFKSVFGPRTYHINVECLPILAYRVLCEVGGSFPEDELIRRVGARVDPQRFGFLQTRKGKGKQVLEDLLRTGSVFGCDDGSVKVVKPLTFVNTAGAKRFEVSLHPSGRGIEHRWF